MLIQIHIRDLATIEELHLQLHKGCTMITGETGAGKSIFIEAIELGLGGRASPNLIRPGKEKADISLCFDLTQFPHLVTRLQASDLMIDNSECMVRRVIMQDGRSRCYINGIPVTVQLVREIGELLFHLHGQHEQQILIKSDTQRDMLDRYADHYPLAQEIKLLAEEWRDLQDQIDTLRQGMQSQQVQQDYLQFQLDEISSLSLQEGEWETLEIEHRRLSHAEELLGHIQDVTQQLTGQEDDILSRLNNLRKTIESVVNVEPKAQEWMQILNSIVIQLTDLESELTHYLNHTELDRNNLQAIEERVSQLFSLARKYKITPPEFISFKQSLIEKLAVLQNSQQHLQELSEKQLIITKKYHQLADQLTQNRRLAAKKLEQEITLTIQSLSLPHGQFKIMLEPDSEQSTPSLYGKEKIIFLIKTNPDQTLQPLAKVMSGGELSRLSLAGHLALAHQTSIPTLVFDEVDTGLSGATAVKIGKLLRHLGKSYQVFCITHQAQVAAYGMHHLLVEKYFLENNTYTRLRLLISPEKTSEIARMLGGEKMTEKTLAHAQEMLDNV